MTTVNAVIFDLDETLVRTASLYEEAVLATFAGFGAPLSSEDFREIYHENVHVVEMLGRLGLGEQESAFRAERDQRYIGLLKEHAAWYPDAIACLAGLPEHLSRGILTGSWRTYVDAIDEKLNLYSRIPAVSTADNFRHCGGKPNPYGLEQLAKHMQVQPKRCVYVGDQDYDMRAARNAGMIACLIRRSYTPQCAEGNADMILDDLQELPEKLAP
ncbi:hypothetical protein COU80_01135 [Candidatus Peregrinibacteria bacterium CG10_big_fil_rev_8_21_14_0_10_55_24]|nr:MAG: hypothetical protein COU80_01135 [Candidatus Peregrinibacteria bacterium CG10_big_fil_rev_8_21_14_0_10_55_24]